MECWPKKKDGVMLFSRLLVFVFAFYSALSFAGVNLKNGNFYISYTDIIVPGGNKSLDITRTYNSKATDIGWFGFGWGSEFETFLKVSADGSVVIHENGAGAKTRFTPRQGAVDAKAASEKIIAAMRKKSSITDKVAKDLIKTLSTNAEVRHAYARKYDVEANLSKGTKLFSNERGLQSITVLASKGDAPHYVRELNSGEKHFFSKAGKLLKKVDKNGYTVNLSYGKSGKLDNIKDSQAKQLFFEWYSDGRLKSVSSGAKDKKASFEYKGLDLVKSTDVSNNTYKFSYDTNHNLVGVDYSDKSKMVIDYEKKTQFVQSVTKRNGEKTSYKYEFNPKNKDLHYWTLVTKSGLSGKPITNRYEYENKIREDGSQYTYRILTVVNGVKTETVYSECCSLPLKIQRGDLVTNFEYNSDGLLTKKTSSTGEFVQLEYEKKYNKIAKVVNNKGWTQFAYDKKGNLTKALNDKGKAVLLLYDRKGRITKMVDDNRKTNKRRTLSFKYNSLGKPVEIAMDKVGKIKVAYDNYGEIKKVDSKTGPKMALQVTQAFQSLLSIVKPAGVSLGI